MFKNRENHHLAALGQNSIKETSCGEPVNDTWPSYFKHAIILTPMQGSMLRAVGRLWRVKITMASEFKVSVASWPLKILAEVLHQHIGEWNGLINPHKWLHLSNPTLKLKYSLNFHSYIYLSISLSLFPPICLSVSVSQKIWYYGHWWIGPAVIEWSHFTQLSDQRH